MDTKKYDARVKELLSEPDAESVRKYYATFEPNLRGLEIKVPISSIC